MLMIDLDGVGDGGSELKDELLNMILIGYTKKFV